MTSPPHPNIVEVDRLEITVEPWTWPFAVAHRDEIDRNFAVLQRARSGIWNGHVLLLNSFAIEDRAVRGTSFETDYASFLAWRDGGYRDTEKVYNLFAAAVLRAGDGSFILGEMGPYTAGAGHVCFPGGTPDREDIGAGGVLDLEYNLQRELKEETGFELSDFSAAPGWTVVHDGGFLALMKHVQARQSPEELRARIMRHLAKEAKPEFVDVRIVRGPADLDAPMWRYLRAYLEWEWQP